MTVKSPHLKARFALAAAALAATHPAAIAQTPPETTAEATEDSSIVVEAPRSLPDPIERGQYTGAPLAVTTIRMPVLYDDLDLTNPADAERLITRIDRIAADACKYLDKLYPLNPDTDCARKSVTKARAAAKELIAAAAPQATP